MIAALALGWVASAPVQTPPSGIGGQTATGQIATSSQLPATMPYGVANGMLVIQASVRDKQPMNAVVATSLPVCLLNPNLGQQYQLLNGPLIDLVTLHGSRRIVGVEPQVLHAGRATVNGVRLGLANAIEILSGRKDMITPDLWLGHSFLSAFCITIDPEKQEFSVRAPATQMPPKALALPFELVDGRPVIVAKAGGVTFRAVIDTTSQGTLIPETVAKEAKLTPDKTFAVVSPDGKKSSAGVATLGELDLGGLVLPFQRVVFPVDSGGKPDDLGIIGLDVLLKYRVTLHYGQSRLGLEKIDPSGPSTATDKSTTRPKNPPKQQEPKKPETKKPEAKPKDTQPTKAVEAKPDPAKPEDKKPSDPKKPSDKKPVEPKKPITFPDDPPPP